MLRVVHVDQRAQPHPGVQLLARHVVAVSGGQERPRLVDGQIVGRSVFMMSACLVMAQNSAHLLVHLPDLSGFT
jgi:hypothetical protein